MPFGLDENNIAQIRDIFRRHTAVERVLIYGSRAMGNYRTGSDIDLCFWGEQLDGDTLNEIAMELDELPMLYSFDISRYDEITNPDLKNHIQRVGKVFYQQTAKPK